MNPCLTPFHGPYFLKSSRQLVLFVRRFAGLTERKNGITSQPLQRQRGRQSVAVEDFEELKVAKARLVEDRIQESTLSEEVADLAPSFVVPTVEIDSNPRVGRDESVVTYCRFVRYPLFHIYVG